MEIYRSVDIKVVTAITSMESAGFVEYLPVVSGYARPPGFARVYMARTPKRGHYVAGRMTDARLVLSGGKAFAASNGSLREHG